MTKKIHVSNAFFFSKHTVCKPSDVLKWTAAQSGTFIFGLLMETVFSLGQKNIVRCLEMNILMGNEKKLFGINGPSILLF